MLLFSRRFLPFFITQFGGAFTDNLYKNALLVYLTLRLSDSKTLSFYTNLSMALFIFPMFLFSACPACSPTASRSASLLCVSNGWKCSSWPSASSPSSSTSFR